MTRSREEEVLLLCSPYNYGTHSLPPFVTYHHTIPPTSHHAFLLTVTMFCCPGAKTDPYKKGILSSHCPNQQTRRNSSRGFYIPWVWSHAIHDVYQLGPLLGQGSFANVHEARTIAQPHKYYAVKVIERGRLQPHDLRHFHDEVQILLDLSHPNIISLYELYKTNDFFFLVMEKLNGGELFDRLCQKDCYSELEARNVCRAVFDAVAYCHEQRVAHRDLKPENLLLQSLNNDAQVKIADFGFCKRVMKPNCLQTRCGTPAYMAPEIVNYKAYDERADNWSLGIIVYSLLGGENPFLEDTVHMTMQQIRQANYNFNGPYWEGISPDAKKFIRGLLTVDPDQRLTSTEALMHPWMTGRSDELGGNIINLDLFKEFNARRKKSTNVKSVSYYWLVARR